MNAQNWAEQDIDRGMSYLADHEQEALDATILTAGNDTKILLPTGLPAFGANVVGMFMMAPLILFMLILTLFPLFSVQILWNGLALSKMQAIILIVISLALLWGLTKVFRLMRKNRELFPRCYFVTLGARGIAMHFTRLHFPFHRPRMSIAWKDIQAVKKNTIAFMPILFFGALRATTIEVISFNGEKIIIPFRLPVEKTLAIAQQIEQLIGQKTRR
jgi:hypothetical protein